MDEFIDKQLDICATLGKRLRQLRLQRNEPQAVFAQRLGISRLTYSRMERGQPGTALGLWVRASLLLDRDREWVSLFREEESLFDRLAQSRKPARKRASRKRA